MTAQEVKVNSALVELCVQYNEAEMERRKNSLRFFESKSDDKDLIEKLTSQTVRSGK